jgi:apolipoprotein N-acyltransferase
MSPTFLDQRNHLRFVPSMPVALGMAVLAGWIMDFGFPDHDIWPLALVGLALMLWSARGLSFHTSLLVGAVGGFSFFGILIWWLTVYLGLVPWIALTLAQVFFFSLGMGLVGLAWHYGSRQWPSLAGRLMITPALVGGAWMTREAVSSVFPFGGFAWARISQSQSESPLAPLVAWLGTSGMSFILAFFVAFLLALITDRRLAWDAKVALAWSAALALAIWPAWPVTETGSIRVLAVQGNADAGLFADYAWGDNLADHHRVTQQLYGTPVDVVIWPENASDVDPLRFPVASDIVSEVSREMNAPLVVGTITRQGSETFNSMLLWEYDAETGRDIVRDQYDKIHPVPFAEYLPWRDFFYPLAPSLFDMVPRDYSFGQRDTVFEVAGSTAGIAICFDIVDDEILWSMMESGADIIFAPTNNADFGRTDQSIQQLSIARMRAIETGRSVVNISTVGTSAVIDPWGRELDRLPTYEEGYMLLDVPLASQTTPATAIGRNLEWGVIGFTLAGILIAMLGEGSRRLTGRTRGRVA